MKTKKILFSFLLAAACSVLFTSCDPEDEQTKSVEVSTGVYVLNQGQQGSNNASLSFYNLADSTSSVDIFKAKNNRALGELAQDMIVYGSKGYITVAGSGVINVINIATGVAEKSISLLTPSNEPASPRSLAAYNGNVYVSLYDGRVAQIDTTKFEVKNIIKVGSNPEGMAISNGKLYVANSFNDSTISVINLSTLSETKIKVVINPMIVKADNYGDIYVLSFGNYYDIPCTLQRIDAAGKVTVIADVKARNFTIAGDYAYIYNYDYENWVVVNKSYSMYDVKNERVYKTNFITSDLIAKTPYSIDVDQTTGNIYIGETDYVNTGKMYCFGADGTLKFSFATGVNPVKTVFVTKK